MHLRRKITNTVKTLGGMLLSMAALLFCSVPATAATEEILTTANAAKHIPCKGLKPFNNIDELLYQFYINLDSDCLFKTPLEELEKQWDIKILSDERMNEENFDPADFDLKPYQSEKDAFYVQASHGIAGGQRAFYMYITKEYHEKHATLFPKGNFPKLLPPPKKKLSNMIVEGPRAGTPTPLRPQNPGQFMMELYHYYWLNSDKTRMIQLTGYYGVVGVKIVNIAEPHFE